MKLSMIVARSLDDVIGVNGGLPWHEPDDLALFKKLTEGKAIVMGRHTWNSLPIRPLPGRLNIIVSSDPNQLHCPVGPQEPGNNPLVVFNLETAISIAKLHDHDEVMFIGGKGIYDAVVDMVDEVHLTEINRYVDPKPEDNVTIFDYRFEYYYPFDPDSSEWECLEQWGTDNLVEGKGGFEYTHIRRRK